MTNGERKDSIDPVEEASLESFPASDPPSWVPIRPGIPAEHAVRRPMSSGEREIWNRALETAAQLVESSKEVRAKLSADIRSKKCSAAD